MNWEQAEHPDVRETESAPDDASCTPETTLISRFRDVASRSGDRLAVQGPSAGRTYRELDSLSDALAARIHATVTCGDRVALWSGPDVDAITAVLAVLKSGAAYVPLDPRQPKAQLAAVLAGTDPALIVTDATHAWVAERLCGGRPILPFGTPGAQRRPFDPQDAPDAPARVPTAAFHPAAQGGPAQSNREVLTQALRFARHVGLTAEDRVPLIARHGLDGATPEMFGTLLTGATLHIVDPYAAPPATLLGDLARQQVTVLRCTLGLLRLLLVQLESGAPVPRLRAVLLADELAATSDRAGVARHLGGATLIDRSDTGEPDQAPEYRVEPAEAEVLLRAHPTVRHAVVVADPDAAPGHRLIGYLTAPGPQSAVPDELLRYLRAALPGYAVPSRLVVLPRLPLDPAGRVERSRLPALFEPGADEGGASHAALDPGLAALWCEVLARETAAAPDQFFASGGDSACVLKLLERVRAEYGVAVSMPAFLAAPTLGNLARLVGDRTPAGK